MSGFFDLPANNIKRTFSGRLLDYLYFFNKTISTDVDPREIQQIDFIGNQEENATISFIFDIVKEIILEIIFALI